MSSSHLSKLPLTNSASSGPFSSSAAFIDIGEFVKQCFPDTGVKGWGTLFVISPDLEEISISLTLDIKEYFLIDDSIDFESVHQRVVIVARGGPSAVVSGPYLSLNDAIKFVKSCSLDTTPAVLIHTARTPRVYRFFWDGTSQPGNTFATYVGGPFARLVLEDFPQAVDWVEEQNVCPAWQIDYLWQIPQKHVPQRDAERRVQNLLRNGLASVLGKEFVIEECSNAAGRADLIILPPTKHFPTNYVELKVVRTYHSVTNPDVDKPRKVYGDRNPRWVLSAIKQAAAYRGKNTNALAHARIYDMRQDKSLKLPSDNALIAASKREVSIKACALHSSASGIQAKAD